LFSGLVVSGAARCDLLPIYLVSLVYLVYLVSLVYLVYLVSLVYLVYLVSRLDRLNDQTD
jgi:hypothetical protein